MKITDEKKQELIVRQAQVNSTIEFFKLIGKKPTLKDVLQISTMMEQFIYNGYSKQFIDEKISKVDEHIMTIQDETQKRVQELMDKRREKNENHNDIY
jgi:hypothetical protein